MRQLGPYTLTRKLGKGGMGEVWMAQRQAMGGAAKSVAIKTLLPEIAENENSREMFLGEARLSMLLSNSNIVQVFDVDEAEDGTCYMAMEWVHGLDLSKLTKELAAVGERLPLHIAAFIVGEILKALAYAHDFETKGARQTVVHRDVTPHNVMLSVAGEIKLMDFGIARLASEETSGVHVKGKFAYMPPEQLRGETREATIDLFAVGAILHELLDGKKFRAGVIDEARLFGMVLDGEIPPLSNPEQVPPEIDALRLGLLAAKVEDRIQTARDAYRMLARWSAYRDAKFDLEDLVRRFVKPEPEVTATYVLPTDSTSPRRTAEGSQTDLSLRSTQQTGSREQSEAAPTLVDRAPAAPAAPRSNTVLLSVALSVGGLGFGVFGVGAMLGWWSKPPAAEQAAAPAAAAPTEPAAAPVEPPPPQPQAPSAAEPAPVAEPPAPEPTPNAEPEPEPEPEPKPDRKPKSVEGLLEQGIQELLKP